MKHLEEYRDGAAAKAVVDAIARTVTRPWVVMEVCGGQTHAIVRYGLAAQHPDRQVVFFAIGFETTAPANAMAVAQARRRGLKNFSLLVSHVLVPPAMTAILDSPENRVQAFLGPGHVCTVMGVAEYEPL